MDYIVIAITLEFLSLRIKFWRKLFASLAGGAFATAFFVMDLSFLNSFIASFFSGILMILAMVFPCRLKEILKMTALLYIVSMLVSGAAFFVMTICGGGIVKNGILYAKTPTILLGGAMVYALVKGFGSTMKRRCAKKNSEVVVEFKGKKINLIGMTDTGNGLVDPKSRKPVMILDEEILKKLVDKKCTLANISEWVESERIRKIPYHTIDREGTFLGIVTDRVYIDGRRVDGAIAAVSEKKLNYQVILHAGM